MEKPKPQVKLSGENGNIFNLGGKCGRALERAGMHDEAKRMYHEVLTSHSYDEALQVLMRYVDVS